MTDEKSTDAVQLDINAILKLLPHRYPFLLVDRVLECLPGTPLMSRDSSNCSTIRELPSELDDVISVTPAMRPSARSSGVATVAAIVSGLAPGSDACTEIVGKSTCGSGETGSMKNAAMPASRTPIVSSVVATGRAMNGAEMEGALSANAARLAPWDGPAGLM